MSDSRRGLPWLASGRRLCGTLAEAVNREWLVADGPGGYAMGTVAGLRTRRYHGLRVVATTSPGTSPIVDPAPRIWKPGTRCR